MARTDLIIIEQDVVRFQAILDQLRLESNAKYILLLDKNGQQIASTGSLGSADSTALASLTAGNVAATEGLAQLIGEPDFSALYHEGDEHSLHISLVSKKVIVLLVFDENSSLGLVRLRVQQYTPHLTSVADDVLLRTASSRAGQTSRAEVLGEISDADIDALFGQAR